MILDSHEHCLSCAYSLAGLPRPYRCPECGLAFDGETVVFRPSRRWRLDARTVFTLVPVLPFALTYMLAPPGVLSWLSLVFLIAPIALIVFFFVRVRLRGGPFVALTADRIVARPLKGSLEWLAYADVGDVSCESEPCVRAKTIVDSGRDALQTRYISLTGLFENNAEMREFERLARERIEQASKVGRLAGGAS